MIPEIPSSHCLICGKYFDIETPDKKCELCDAPYHSECWDFNEGCARPGCVNAPKKIKTEESVDLIIPEPVYSPSAKLWAVSKRITSVSVRYVFSSIISIILFFLYPILHPVKSASLVLEGFCDWVTDHLFFEDERVKYRPKTLAFNALVVGLITLVSFGFDNPILFIFQWTFVGLVNIMYLGFSTDLYNSGSQTKIIPPIYWLPCAIIKQILLLAFFVIKLPYTFPRFLISELPPALKGIYSFLLKKGESLIEEEQTKLIETKKSRVNGAKE